MRSMFIGLAALGALTAAVPAQAGVYSDDLAKCMVRNISAQEQSDIVLWIFSAISSHPNVRQFSAVTPAQQSDFNGKAAKLVERLLTQACRTEAVSALRHEGDSALEPAFNVLGQSAMRGLLTNPAVMAQLEAFAGGVDRTKLDALSKEVGASVP